MLNLKKLVIPIILILLVLGTVIIIRTRNKTQEPILPVLPASEPTSQPISETKSNSQGNVVVEVTPEKLGLNEPQNIFEVKLNTHSVDLDFDFEKIMVLMDDLGNQYQAIRWEGEKGGHHLEGKIVFPQLKAGGQKVTLKMAQIGGVERNFSWDLTENIDKR